MQEDDQKALLYEEPARVLETTDIVATLNEARAQNPNLKLFALLDTSADDALFFTLTVKAPDANYELLFDDLLDVEPSPVLVELDVDSPLAEHLIQREQQFNINFLVFYLSDVALAHQMPHWQRVLFVKDPEGKTLLFRYFDPRVLTAYLYVSTRKERSRMLGPAHQIWVHGYGTWYGLINPLVTPGERTTALGVPTLTLRPEHLASADKLAEINMVEIVTAYLRDDSPHLVERYHPVRLGTMVFSALNRAKRYGINDESSLCAWAKIMFDVSPNFDDQPAIHEALRNASIAPVDRLQYAIDQTTEQDWEAAGDLYDPAAWELFSVEDEQMYT